jgi:hypothetical protein
MGLDLTVVPLGLPAQPVDGPVAGGGGDPGAGVRRQPGLRPGRGRGQEGLLDRLLGQVDAAEDPDERGDRPAGLRAEDPADLVAVDAAQLAALPLPDWPEWSA